MNHPEQIPSNGPVNSFNFSFSKVNKNYVALENELNDLTERIIKIIDSEKFFINNFPVLKNIYSLNPNKSDLKKLSKACDRLADLVQISADLESKMIVFEIAKNNPNWLAFTFGDFQDEINKDLESFFSED